MKVSVIIPNYNHAQYLRQRIETVLNQTYKNFEVIILDDCSTDHSDTVINSYKSHPYISHIVINKSNTGSPFRQWEKGIELSTGDWIWIAESDDYADERFLESLIAAISKYPNVGLAYCDSRGVTNDIVSDETFANRKNKNFHTNRWSSDYFNSGIDEIENYLLPGGTINNSSAVLFNRKMLIEVNPFDIPLRFIGDKYAFIKILAHSNVVYVRDALNYFRDPFNSKYLNKLLFYFYEQFLVFDWTYRNITLTSKEKFMNGLYANTRNSLFRHWNLQKLLLYWKLLLLNPYLLTRSILYNLGAAVDSVIKPKNKYRDPENN